MKVSFARILGFCSTAACALALASFAHAQIVVDGSLDAGYGSALAVQTINTGFGDSTAGDGTSAGGSELDAGYGVISAGNLYLFLAGNHEDNGNHVNVFVSGGAAGQATLAVPETATLQAMNGSLFSPGFQATYALDINDYQGTDYVEAYNLTGTPSGGYAGSIPLTGGIGTGTLGGSTIGDNNTNAAGVNGNSGTAANPVAALAVQTGLELAIPLSAIGYTGGSIEVLADINGGGDGYLSNQFLPGLPVGTGNLGTAEFNFSSTPGEYFTVTAPVPEPATLTLLGSALLGLGVVYLRWRRRAKA